MPLINMLITLQAILSILTFFLVQRQQALLRISFPPSVAVIHRGKYGQLEVIYFNCRKRIR
jgi:hypothetical protein